MGTQVIYVDHRTNVTYDSTNGQLRGYIIEGGTEDAVYQISEKAKMVEKDGNTTILPIDSKRAHALQIAYDEIRKAYQELVPGYYPEENRTELHADKIYSFGKWVKEYAANELKMDAISQWQAYLALRAMRAAYSSLNWREKAQVWAAPEKTLASMNYFKKILAKIEYPRPIFEEYLNMEQENDAFSSFQIDLKKVEAEYFEDCKERGLVVLEDAWEWGPPLPEKKS